MKLKHNIILAILIAVTGACIAQQPALTPTGAVTLVASPIKTWEGPYTSPTITGTNISGLLPTSNLIAIFRNGVRLYTSSADYTFIAGTITFSANLQLSSTDQLAVEWQ